MPNDLCLMEQYQGLIRINNRGVTMLALFFLCLGLIISAVRVFFFGDAMTTAFMDWVIISSIGCYGVIHFLTLMFDQKRVANIYGWQTVTPFQTMIAFCYLAFGLLGLSAFFFKGTPRLALMITPMVLYVCTAYLQITNIKKCYHRSFDALGYIIANVAVPSILAGLFVADYCLSM